MLRLMRDHAGSWLIKIILGAIVVVFIFWGVGNFQSQRMSQIATVNGETITVEEYRKTYNNMLEQYRRRFGGNLDENMLKMLNLKQTALDSLIDQVLIRQEAAKLDFRISDAELAKSIMEVPAFQNSGAFDNDLYNRVLRLNRLTAEEFEAMQRESMLSERLRSFVLDAVKVSDAEALEWYQWNNASADMEYVFFDPQKYTDISPSDEEISQYYEKNRDSYKTEEKIRARYAEFRHADFTDKVTVTDEDIAEYFESHADEFKVEKTVEASHILFRLDSNAAEEEAEKKRAKAEEVLKMAREGKDFAQLANEYSEDPGNNGKGGHLGAFKKDAMVKPFSDKAFSMKAGEISEPVRTPFGWHIIKVEKINEASEKKLEDVKEDIRKKLAEEKARIMAYDQAEALYDAIPEGDDLKKNAEEHKKEVLETDFFTRGKGPEKVKNSSQFATAAFALSEKQISTVQDMGDAFYLIQVTQKVPSAVSPLEEVKEKVRADLIAQKQEEKAKSDAEAFLAGLKNSKAEKHDDTADPTAEKSADQEGRTDPAKEESETAGDKTGEKTAAEDKSDTDAPSSGDSAQKKNGEPAFVPTGFFRRNAAIPQIGYEQEISQAAFRLSAENPLPEKPLKGKNGYYVIRFKDRKLPDAAEFEKEKSSVKERLLRQKQYKTFETWLGQLREKSKITRQEDLLN
ncbi:MAG: SurA N-terminal domain-containing protein [Desulfobacterales bacterium]